MRIATAIVIAAAVLASGAQANAATKGKDAAMAQREASCKAQAAQKYSAIHFLKRRTFVKNCMHENFAKVQKPAVRKPAETTGQKTR